MERRKERLLQAKNNVQFLRNVKWKMQKVKEFQVAEITKGVKF